MMSAKILFVDDEDYVLKAICRFFRGTYDVHTALNADEAIQLLTTDTSFAAVVADVRMPGMSGIDFLRHAHEFAPQTTRVLLTGQISAADSLRAVNEGHVFQILMKPCPVGVMHSALEAAVHQHRSLQARSMLLKESYATGNAKVLFDILAMVSPSAAGRATRIKDLACTVAKHIGIDSDSEIATTALLSQFGCIAVSPRILSAWDNGGDKLSEADAARFREHPTIAANLLSAIPEFREIARSIELQFKNFDGSGSPATEICGEAIPLASRILRAVSDFDLYTSQRMSPKDAIACMLRQSAFYDPKVMRAIKELNRIEETTQLLELNVEDIRIGMTLECAVGTTDGRTLLAKGSLVTESMLTRLRAFARGGNVVQPILVSGLFPQVSEVPISVPSEATVAESTPAMA